MRIVFDPTKDEANREKHGVSLADFTGFDEGSSVTRVDDRHEYGETRLISVGLIEGVPHALVWVQIEDGARAISFRRCRWKELRRHGGT